MLSDLKDILETALLCIAAVVALAFFLFTPFGWVGMYLLWRQFKIGK